MPPSSNPSSEPLDIDINGFGAIGALVARQILEAGDSSPFRIRHINDAGKSRDTVVKSLRKNSTYGKFGGEVITEGDDIKANGQLIKLAQTRDIDAIDRSKSDMLFECTGAIKDPADLAKFISKGTQRVMLSVPAKGERTIPTIVHGVNHQTLTKKDTIVSGASCTTNALAPIAKLMHEKFGIISGDMVSIHAVTNGQPVVDSFTDTNGTRGASAFGEAIPTTTGAAAAIGLVLPELAGKLDGHAVRIPMRTGSFIELALSLKKRPTREDIENAIREEVLANPSGPLGFAEASEDFTLTDVWKETRTSLVNFAQTRVIAPDSESPMTHLEVAYDNQWTYVLQLLRTAQHVADLMNQ